MNRKLIPSKISDTPTKVPNKDRENSGLSNRLKKYPPITTESNPLKITIPQPGRLLLVNPKIMRVRPLKIIITIMMVVMVISPSSGLKRINRAPTI